jgi:hypothetical protein
LRSVARPLVRLVDIRALNFAAIDHGPRVG